MIMKSVVSGQWSVVSRTPGEPSPARPRRRSGITLTEILISIMILGVGLVSLATLFPIGLLRLRDATRYTRSATLLQTAASDAICAGCSAASRSQYADCSTTCEQPVTALLVLLDDPDATGYNPLIQDTRLLRRRRLHRRTTSTPVRHTPSALSSPRGGPGLPFAYDPLWRYQTVSTAERHAGLLPSAIPYEARFGYGLTTIRTRQVGIDGNGPPSATASSGSPTSIAVRQRQRPDPDHAGVDFVPEHLRLAGGRGLAGPERTTLHDQRGQQSGTSVTEPEPGAPRPARRRPASPTAGAPRSTGAIPGCSPASSATPATCRASTATS